MLKTALYNLITNIYNIDKSYIYDYLEIYNCISISFYSIDTNLNIKPLINYLESTGLNKYFSVNLICQCAHNTFIPNGRNNNGEFINKSMRVYSYKFNIELITNIDINILLGYFKILNLI